ncbi:MAG: hypothetical protein P8J74_06555 [Woeseiaceae bacterium]|nr:hypothetical protein [Woeseiaceae bacterium]
MLIIDVDFKLIEKNMKNFLTAGILLVALCGCATTYTTDNFSEYQSSHKIVAIVPFVVSMNSGNRGKEVTREDLLAEEATQSLNFQRAVYTEFLEKIEKNKVTVSFQDIDDTNVLIQRAGGFDEQGKLTLTKQELGELLKVDAVISGSMVLSKPMGTGAAVVTTLLTGWGVTNEAKINLTIHDSSSGILVWSYDHSASGGLISSPQMLAKNLMKNIASKFPYKVSNIK